MTAHATGTPVRTVPRFVLIVISGRHSGSTAVPQGASIAVQTPPTIVLNRDPGPSVMFGAFIDLGACFVELGGACSTIVSAVGVFVNSAAVPPTPPEKLNSGSTGSNGLNSPAVPPTPPETASCRIRA